jgi:hypothetical protein
MTVWGTSQDEPLCRCLRRDGRPPALAGRNKAAPTMTKTPGTQPPVQARAAPDGAELWLVALAPSSPAGMLARWARARGGRFEPEGRLGARWFLPDHWW